MCHPCEARREAAVSLRRTRASGSLACASLTAQTATATAGEKWTLRDEPDLAAERLDRRVRSVVGWRDGGGGSSAATASKIALTCECSMAGVTVCLYMDAELTCEALLSLVTRIVCPRPVRWRLAELRRGICSR